MIYCAIESMNANSFEYDIIFCNLPKLRSTCYYYYLDSRIYDSSELLTSKVFVSVKIVGVPANQSLQKFSNAARTSLIRVVTIVKIFMMKYIKPY